LVSTGGYFGKKILVGRYVRVSYPVGRVMMRGKIID